MATTAIRLLLALVGSVLVGWALGALCRSQLTPDDLRIVRDVVSQRTPALTSVWRVVSFIGSGYVVFPLTLLACVMLYRGGRRGSAAAVGLSTFGAVAIANLDKVLVGRPRPPVHHLAIVSSDSFPSGHVTHTAAFCTALVLVFCAARPARWLCVLAAAAACLLVAAVAFSRVYLGVHYPTDVLAGALLGTTWAVVAARLLAAPAARGSPAS